MPAFISIDPITCIFIAITCKKIQLCPEWCIHQDNNRKHFLNLLHAPHSYPCEQV